MHAAPVLKILGLLLSILAVSMLIPMSFDLVNGNADWQAFLPLHLCFPASSAFACGWPTAK